MTAPLSLGSRLRELRGSLTQKKAAAKLDCDFTYLSKVESGSMHPSWRFLKKAFEVYKIDKKEQRAFAYWHLAQTHNEEFAMALLYLHSI